MRRPALLVLLAVVGLLLAAVAWASVASVDVERGVWSEVVAAILGGLATLIGESYRRARAASAQVEKASGPEPSPSPSPSSRPTPGKPTPLPQHERDIDDLTRRVIGLEVDVGFVKSRMGVVTRIDARLDAVARHLGLGLVDTDEPA